MEREKIANHVINVSVLSEALMHEMDQLRDSEYWSRAVKSSGKQFNNAITRQTHKMYKDLGGSSEHLGPQIDVFTAIFDRICKMEAKERIDLLDKLKNDGYKSHYMRADPEDFGYVKILSSGNLFKSGELSSPEEIQEKYNENNIK